MTAKLTTPRGQTSAYRTTSDINGVGTAQNSKNLYSFTFTAAGVSGTIEDFGPVWPSSVSADSPATLAPLRSVLKSGTVTYAMLDNSATPPELLDSGSFDLAGTPGNITGCHLSARSDTSDLFLDCTPLMQVKLAQISINGMADVKADLVIESVDLTAAASLAATKPQT